MYVFVRQDLPVAAQIVQSNHAVYHLASLRCPDPEAVPNLIVIGLPDAAGLRRVLAKLQSHHIVHYVWNEPDDDLGLTAIATAAISGEQRAALRNYRLWNDHSPVGSKASPSPSKGEGAGSNPAGGAISVPGGERQLTA